jgi:hypothetical protein
LLDLPARGYDYFKITEKDTADLLAEANDPDRPQPDVVFDDEYGLETGG